MKIGWPAIERGAIAAADGSAVEVSGWFVPVAPGQVDYGALVADAGCCGGAPALRVATTVEVFLAAPIDAPAAMPLTLRGQWRQGEPGGWRFQLHAASVVGRGASRRLFLGAAALGLAACSAGPFQGYRDGAAGSGSPASGGRPSAAAGSGAAGTPDSGAAGAGVTIDIHSHAGQVIVARNEAVAGPRPFAPLAAPMREGGLHVVCLAIVADTPATRTSADGQRFKPYRDPAPGELYRHAQAAFARAAALIAREGLDVVDDAGSLRAAPGRGPAVIVAAEGADFLEGRIERVDEAWRLHRLRHLQLTHYRVNELGDIQTEPPVHGGLTDFGAAVIERCNALGIVVDVAHGPFDLVRRAARVTTRPLVLSHTSLAARPGPRSRQISAAHAKLVAETGGVIGVWPNAAVYADLDAMARGARRLADAVGADHVALGSDMLGFIVPPVLRSYRHLPAYATALRGAGFTTGEVEKVLGANYLRVFESVLAGSAPRS